MKILDKIEEYICAVCTVVMTLLVFANVLSRYVLHMSLSFSDEITTNLFIQYVNNPALVISTIAGVTLLIALIAFLIYKKKKKG